MASPHRRPKNKRAGGGRFLLRNMRA
ncbi:hypothetical protein CCACVL1_14927 [Corchorus capsularis]|uniref:Uncharacterized protein n=1 Tax=Corchorus capsularis TaxID=210143 RepID=A0A1R3I4X8_COCAP|nr:hypothetical protein CCACVL1_14927 [Corchorus capsularis]